MSEDPTRSFAERFAQGLYDFEWILFLATGIWILVYLFPIYKRIRSRGLLLLLIATALSAFVTLFDANLEKFIRPGSNDVWTYYAVREVVWYASTIIYPAGLLLLARDYARLAGGTDGIPSSSVFPPPVLKGPEDRDRSL